MISIDLSKQQALDADPGAIQQINFTGNLDRAGNTRIFFILEEAKETVLEFSQRSHKSIANVLQNAVSLNNLNFINIKWLNVNIIV